MSENSMDLEIRQAEAENRIQNLVWTISGDYQLKVQPDVDLFLRSRYRGLYHAILEGGFFRFYDRNEFSLYLLKKLYYEADEKELGKVVKLCMDAAIWRPLSQDHPGILKIRLRSAEDFLETEFQRCSVSPLGRLQLAWQGTAAQGEGKVYDAKTAEAMDLLRTLEEDIMKKTLLQQKLSPGSVIAVADRIYNLLSDPGFERKHGDLEHVLNVTLDELTEASFDWKDFLQEEEEIPDSLNDFRDPDVSAQPSSEKKKRNENRVIQLDEKTRAKAYQYMELNYGRSYMKPLEQKRINYAVCRGNHEGCSLYFTEGILNNMVRKNYQSEYVRRQVEQNKTTYRRNRQMARKNIQILSDTLRQALMRSQEEERIRGKSGLICPRELWQIGRTKEPKIFEKVIQRNHSDFVVDILMDASSSQRDRSGEVAVQGYIISEALSQVGIPHRVQSFCTCWDYTILERFREYEDPREKNENIFQYSTSANNRDGLAVKAVVHSLIQRPEENKILIVLSDGRPNDRIVNRTVSRAPVLYTGEFAVRDTAEEIRRARNLGIAVLGVFAGEESDLDAEKRIFGKDFAYIRNIRNFSHMVGRYLKKQLDINEN
ncbi:MAG: nitric oxide reductase activation protein [Clostridiales bacterium]|nr:nitric oxide reductase activation protein [Clostridiales bacterium]